MSCLVKEDSCFGFNERVAYDSGATEAGKSVKHKPVGGQTNNAKSGGPWGAKGMSMSVRTRVSEMLRTEDGQRILRQMARTFSSSYGNNFQRCSKAKVNGQVAESM